MLVFSFRLIDDLIGPEASGARACLSVHGNLGCYSSPLDRPGNLALMIVGLLDVVRYVAVVGGVSEVELVHDGSSLVLRISSRGGFVGIDDEEGRRYYSGTVDELVRAARRDIVPVAEHLCRCFGPTDPPTTMLRDELDDFETVIDARV